MREDEDEDEGGDQLRVKEMMGVGLIKDAHRVDSISPGS